MTTEQSTTKRPWLADYPLAATNKKVGGVAGGLGRVLKIDPVLLRVLFIVMTIFGGSGIALYAGAWMLMPTRSGEYSGLEALLGRGRSSMSSAMAILLCVVTVVGAGSAFSWGLVLMPVALILTVLFLVVGRRRGWTEKLEQDLPWVRTVTDQWQSTVGSTSQGRQPNQYPTTETMPVQPTEPAGGAEIYDPTEVSEPAAPTPPSWDPLGAAPFAWDLPEPPPLEAEPEPETPTPRSSLATLTIGLVLLMVATASLGNSMGLWDLPPANIGAIALVLIALAIIIAAFSGRPSKLIGVGVLVSVLTMLLYLTGYAGKGDFGQHIWQPESKEQVASDYRIALGDGTLDLREVKLTKGETVRVNIEVNIGKVVVLLPANAPNEFRVSCRVRAGSAQCVDQQLSGLNQWGYFTTENAHRSSDDTHGTFDINVTAGIGNVEVRRG